MSPVEEATVEVFLKAFRTLKRGQRQAFLDHLLQEKPYREDLLDLALIERRRREPPRSFRDYLADRHARRGHR